VQIETRKVESGSAWSHGRIVDHAYFAAHDSLNNHWATWKAHYLATIIEGEVAEPGLIEP
jgi:hypothetical protein